MDDARAAEDFLSRLPDEKRKLVEMVRRTVLQADERIEETIKWGNLTFVKNRKNIAFVYTNDKAPYINFGFLKATSLKDPKGLFQGTGKGMRHVKIYSEKDIDRKQYTAWVKEAVQLEEVVDGIQAGQYIQYIYAGYLLTKRMACQFKIMQFESK